MATLLVRSGAFRDLVGTSKRPLLGLVIVTAIAAAWYPPALLVPAVVGAVLLAVSVLGGGANAPLRATGAGLVAGAAGAVLLLPWSATFGAVADDPAAFGVALHPRLDLVEVLRFQTGPAGAGLASWGLLAAALAGLVLAKGPRLAWAVRGWALIVAGYAFVYLPARLAPDAAVAAPEAGLAIAALGAAIAAGIAVGVLGGELRGGRLLDWHRAVAIVACGGVALIGLGYAADAIDGRWDAPDETWADTLAFARDRQFEGEFRVLWLGDPAALPLDPVDVRGELSYVLTRNGSGDARELWRAPVERADDFVGDAVVAALDGRTSRLGRVLAPMGVRYVAIPGRDAPEGIRYPAPPGTAAALAGQLDLERLRTEGAIVLYENAAWVPSESILAGRDDALPEDPGDPLREMAETMLTGAASVGPTPVPAGTLLLSEAFDEGWHADADDTQLESRRAFGLVNQFALGEEATVGFDHDGQGRRFALIAAQVALWLVAIAWWARGRRRGPRPRVERARRERERASRRDLTFGLDDFWDAQ
jgi:hypothetical protein